MDQLSSITAVQLPTDIGSSLQTPAPPLAPPELVAKFESLMANAPTTSEVNAGSSVVPTSAVSAADAYLRGYADLMSSTVQFQDGLMSIADMQRVQLESMAKLCTMSMMQTSCIQVVGSSKNAVSSLMKNQ